MKTPVSILVKHGNFVIKPFEILKIIIGLLVLSLSLVCTVQIHASPDESDTFAQLVSELPASKLKNLPKLIDQLSEVTDERLLPTFESMLAGKLYYVKSDSRVVMIIDESDDQSTYKVQSVLNDEVLEALPKKSLKKIRVNNKLRKQLRKAIAKLTLFSTDKNLRLTAVDNLMNDLNSENIQLLQQAAEQ
jgi:urea transport system permease protein